MLPAREGVTNSFPSNFPKAAIIDAEAVLGQKEISTGCQILVGSLFVRLPFHLLGVSHIPGWPWASAY